MFKQILLLFCFIFLFSKSIQAQKKIDVNKDIDLIEVYDNYVKDGYGNAEIYKKLANGFYFKSNYIKAKVYFEKLFQLQKPTEKQQIRYRQTLRALNIDTAHNTYLAMAIN